MLRLEFVYVVTGEMGFAKIGICRPPEMPADALRAGSIRPIEIVWVVATNGDADAIARQAHLRLGASRHSDEWFSLPPFAMIEAVEWAARELGHPLLSVGPLNAFARASRPPGFIGWLTRVVEDTRTRVAIVLMALAGFATLAFANRAALSRLLGPLG